MASATDTTDTAPNELECETDKDDLCGRQGAAGSDPQPQQLLVQKQAEPEPESTRTPQLHTELQHHLPYTGGFVAVTSGTSPYADPSSFVEEGVPTTAEFLTNYPHLEVLAKPNPRRSVVYKPIEQPGNSPVQKKELGRPTMAASCSMQVTTPNRHTEIMLGIESALRRLYDAQDENPHRLVGGLHMQQVTVLKVASANASRSPSGSVYAETSAHGLRSDTSSKNLWIHVSSLL